MPLISDLPLRNHKSLFVCFFLVVFRSVMHLTLLLATICCYKDLVRLVYLHGFLLDVVLDLTLYIRPPVLAVAGVTWGKTGQMEVKDKI